MYPKRGFIATFIKDLFDLPDVVCGGDFVLRRRVCIRPLSLIL
jgi:hypothetical protein